MTPDWWCAVVLLSYVILFLFSDGLGKLHQEPVTFILCDEPLVGIVKDEAGAVTYTGNDDY